jgi:ribosomal protein L37AE/L43A
MTRRFKKTDIDVSCKFCGHKQTYKGKLATWTCSDCRRKQPVPGRGKCSGR